MLTPTSPVPTTADPPAVRPGSGRTGPDRSRAALAAGRAAVGSRTTCAGSRGLLEAGVGADAGVRGISFAPPGRASPTSDEYERFGIDRRRPFATTGSIWCLDREHRRRGPTGSLGDGGMPHVGDQFLDYRLLAELGAGHLAGRSWRNGPGALALKAVRRSAPNRSRVYDIRTSFRSRKCFTSDRFRGGDALSRRDHIGPRPESHRRVGGSTDPRSCFVCGGPARITARELSVADAALRPALEAVYYADAVLWLAAQLADGLAYAHRQGVLHLDLKPANVLFSAVGRPMLLDFHPADHGITEEAGGTLPYMSPEQIDAFRGRPATWMLGRTCFRSACCSTSFSPVGCHMRRRETHLPPDWLSPSRSGWRRRPIPWP